MLGKLLEDRGVPRPDPGGPEHVRTGHPDPGLGRVGQIEGDADVQLFWSARGRTSHPRAGKGSTTHPPSRGKNVRPGAIPAVLGAMSKSPTRRVDSCMPLLLVAADEVPQRTNVLR
jgi:hypothetical protein